MKMTTSNCGIQQARTDMRKSINQTSAPTASTEPIHVKYRPRRLADVLGQKPVIKSLQAAFKDKARPHCFMFTGPAGTGKTTLARIGADECEVTTANVTEVDAASKSGIDDMKAVLMPLQYNGFGDSPNKALIIDECHRLSKQAWDSLLKITEEPASHVFFFFCTTEPEKVPKTIVTRCLAYHLQPLRGEDLLDMLEAACDGERYDTPDAVLRMIVGACGGSGREALTMLAKVHDCDPAEAEVLLQTPGDNKEVIDLCRLLVKGDLTWPKLCATLKGLEDTPPESVRIIIVNYLNACLMGARSDSDAMRLLDILECFLKPGNASDKWAPVLVAFGRHIFPA